MYSLYISLTVFPHTALWITHSRLCLSCVYPYCSLQTLWSHGNLFNTPYLKLLENDRYACQFASITWLWIRVLSWPFPEQKPSVIGHAIRRSGCSELCCRMRCNSRGIKNCLSSPARLPEAALTHGSSSFTAHQGRESRAPNNSFVCCRRTGGLWQHWNTAPECCFSHFPEPRGNKTQQIRRKGSRGSDSNGWDLGSTWTALSSGYCSLQTGDGWLYFSWPWATSSD